MATAGPDYECLWAEVDVMVERMIAGYGISLGYTRVLKMERLSYLRIIAIYPMFSLVMMRLL